MFIDRLMCTLYMMSFLLCHTYMFEVGGIPDDTALSSSRLATCSLGAYRSKKHFIFFLAQGIDIAGTSQYRTISNYFRTRANNIAAYPGDILKDM